MKKILSLVLVLSLVLGTFSFAFADGHLPEDIVGEDSEEAVATLMALGVVNGYPDGTFKPEKTVTRAEMAKLLVEALGYGELAEGATASFADAQGHWAESYVGFAASMDLVLGYPDGTFKPDAVMTMDEAMTMIIRALGYTDEVLKGSWPTNYKVKALDLGLTEGLATLSGEGLRGNVAMLLFNALDVGLVEVIKDANGLFTYEYVTTDGTTIKTLLDKIGNLKEDQEITYAKVYGDNPLASSVDLSEYLYHTVDYYTNSDGEVAYIANVDTSEFVGTLTTAASFEVTNANDVSEAFTVDANTPLFLNEDATILTPGALTDGDKTDVKVVYSGDLDGTATVQGVIAMDYTLHEMANTYSVRSPLKLDRTSIPLPKDEDGNLDEANLTIEGDATALTEIEKGDLVYVYATDNKTANTDDPNKVKLLVVRDTYEGKVTEVDTTNDTAVVGGVTFTDGLDVQTNLVSPANVGADVVLTLDKDGEVYDWKPADTTTEVDTEYAIYVEAGNGKVGIDSFLDRYVMTTPKVKVFTTNGDVVVYDLDISDIDLTSNGAQTVTLGSITVEFDGSDSSTLTVAAIDPAVTTFRALVELTMNDDGELTSVGTTSAMQSTYAYSNELMDSKYDVDDDTIVLDISGNDETKWTVEGKALLGTSGTAAYITDADYDVVIAAVTDSDSDVAGTDATFAVVKSFVDYYDADQDAAVQKVTVWVDGTEMVYVTTATNTAIEADKEVVSEITIDDEGYLTNITQAAVGKSITVAAIEGMKLRAESDDTLSTLADDVTVYLYDGTEMTIGEFADILVEDQVHLYDTNDDGEYRLAVIDI
jgi:hypothetical protein